ncbi:MAG: helicase HerA-like domain-containing protein, partial [Saprospiraceae bacterium]
MKEKFVEELTAKYNTKGPSLIFGKGMLNKEVVPEVTVGLPLKMFNRHGLIAGATGTGKTKTLQVIAEGLSNAGVPSLVMDIKGDLSGLAEPGDQDNVHIQNRHDKLQIPYESIG